MRFYCHVHKCSFTVAGAGSIECEKGKHLLGVAPSDTSALDLWEYCSDCQNFWLVSPDGPGSMQCPVCERAIAARYLCDKCNTVTLESVFPAKGRSIFFSLQGTPRPHCPGCRNVEYNKPVPHDCEAYDERLATLRAECAFCHEAITTLPSFPCSVNDFVTQTTSELIEVSFDKATLRFRPSTPGTFVLLEGNSTLPGNILLPNLCRFENAAEFQTYEHSYSCDEVGPGEIVVLYPATVANDGDAWSLKTAGRLRVNAATDKSSKPAPTPANIFEARSSAATPAPDPVFVDLVECEACSELRNVESESCEHCGAGAADNDSWSTDTAELFDNVNDLSAPKRGLLIPFLLLTVLATTVFAWMLVFARKDSPPDPQPNQNSQSKSVPQQSSSRDSDVPKGMVLIPGGEFVMGTDTGDEYERPAHSVKVQPFYIDLYEVTCANYAEFLKATNHKAPDGWSTRVCGTNAQQQPVTGVDWFDAAAYASWRGARLPTEAEWEFAARGTDGRRYPWGDDWQANMANAGDNSSGALVNVGSYPNGRSPFGVYDMVGNAWEWTSSALRPYPGNKFRKQPEGERRIMRGGSWARDDPPDWTTTFRGFAAPAGGADYGKTGFRCVQDVPASQRKK